MCATIYDVHHRNRENVCVSTANVTVKRNIESLCSRLSYSKRYAENGICTDGIEYQYGDFYSGCTDRYLYDDTEGRKKIRW